MDGSHSSLHAAPLSSLLPVSVAFLELRNCSFDRLSSRDGWIGGLLLVSSSVGVRHVVACIGVEVRAGVAHS